MNTTGYQNSFFGYDAGKANTTGFDNTFFGARAGEANTSGEGNTFVGAQAGVFNTTGLQNAFFGLASGLANTTGRNNAFFGSGVGPNSNGEFNTFIGSRSGHQNTSGTRNTFLGYESGPSNTTESDNIFIGYRTNGVAGITNATAIGVHASVTQSNSLVLGSINGVNSATASTNVGIGTTAPLSRLDVRGDIFVGLAAVPDSVGSNSLFVSNDRGVTQNSFRIDGDGNNLYLIARSGAGASSGAGIVFRTATAGAGEADRVSIDPNGIVAMNVLGGGGLAQLCRNALNQISFCASSLRYKRQIATYKAGLELIRRLRPISFTWKTNGTRDLGLGAEDVAKVEPLLVTHNDKGEIEGVKYNHLNVVLINAIKQQQAQIDQQRTEIRSLKQIICSGRRKVRVCR